MPFYELKCKQCGREFEVRASIAERTAGTIPCPDCGGTRHEPVYRHGPAVHLSKEPACPHAAQCGGRCPHAK